MAEQKRTDIVIEGNIASWHLHLEGDIQGTYAGKFRFKCYLSPSERIAAGREMRDMLGSNPALASEHESFLAFALTQLKYRVLEAPPFWNTGKLGAINGDIPDSNVISTVLDAAVEAESLYMSQLADRKKSALEKAIKAAERLIKNKNEDEADVEQQDKT